jgi:poly-gamma-glutamate synthesis protein (capsule biosynthesis protein)
MLWGALILALLTAQGCQKEPSVTITFGGDVMLARNGVALFERADPWGDVDKYLEVLRSKDSQLLFLVNLESPLSVDVSEDGANTYDLCADSSQALVLKSVQIDMVSLVNNHSFDCAPDGMARSIRILTDNSIGFVGDIFSPTFVVINGVKVGVIAAEDVAAPVDQQGLLSAIRDVRKQCDFLIVSMHWGMEYQAGISERQEAMAQAIADAGADVLWGHHPHVLQKMEWISAASGEHRMLAIYSMGNLLSDQGMNKDTQETALISVIVKDEKITQIQIQPFVMDVYRMELRYADVEEAQDVLDRLKVDQLSGVELVIP